MSFEMTQNLLINPYFMHNFKPLDVLSKQKGSFYCQGSLDCLVKYINDGILPDFETKSDLKAESKDIVMSAEDITMLENKYGMKLGNVRISDKSDLKDKLTAYFQEHVILKDTWKQILGKNIWIVLSGYYTDSVDKTTKEVKFFTTKTSHSTVSTKGDDWIMFGFTCLKMKVKRDGTIGKAKIVKK